MSPEAHGWPFLIGAGRRHEYRTLVAPDFLVEAAAYGALDRYVGRTADGEIGAVEIRWADRPFWAVYRTETVTEADVPDPRDEHGRPLQVLAGFVCPGRVPAPDTADLAVARDAGMAVYRRYLDAEDRFGVVASTPFPLRSVLPRAAMTAGARSTRITPGAPSAARSPRIRPAWALRRTTWVLGLAALAAAVIAVLVLIVPGGGEPQPTDPSCAPSTASGTADTGVVDC